VMNDEVIQHKLLTITINIASSSVGQYCSPKS
jgi:hypothetical protein